jgi:hypothetical protein
LTAAGRAHRGGRDAGHRHRARVRGACDGERTPRLLRSPFFCRGRRRVTCLCSRLPWRRLTSGQLRGDHRALHPAPDGPVGRAVFLSGEGSKDPAQQPSLIGVVLTLGHDQHVMRLPHDRVRRRSVPVPPIHATGPRTARREPQRHLPANDSPTQGSTLNGSRDSGEELALRRAVPR